MIDWDRVTTLRDEVGRDSFDEVVALFLEEVDEVIARFRARPDPGQVEHDLHFLKGAALNLGCSGLGDLCQAGERLAANGGADQVDIAAVITLYEESRRCLLEGLSAVRAA